MSERAIKDLVIANRILAHLGVFDAEGSISLRDLQHADRFLLAGGRSPALVGIDDILQFTLDGAPPEKTARVLDGDRFIHAAIYEARPDVQAVLHANSEYIQPFTVSATALRPVLATVGDMGAQVPVWDIADRSGAATDLAIDSMEKARDLARCLGSHRVVLMRGVGFVAIGRTLNDVVRRSVYIPRNARILVASSGMGRIAELSSGEMRARWAFDPESPAMRRGWEYWARAAGCEEFL
jgi:HCOMODA/2-hydroxy-3-carboxy-muconic semialdehyde decarboxylase